MQNIELWKIGIDLLLFLSLLWFGWISFRATKETSRGELTHLEGSIRALIQEADQAGKTLNDQLTKRERSLERILFDGEGIEHRITLALERSERMELSLSELIERAKGTRPQEYAPTRPPPQRVVSPESFESHPEPASFTSSSGRNIYGEVLSQSNAHSEREVPPPRSSQRAPVKKQEEEIPAAQRSYARAVHRYQDTLAGSVEREVVPSSVAESVRAPVDKRTLPSNTRAMDRILEAAEKLLRAGRDIETVAAVTKLPLEELQALAALVRSDEKASSSPERRAQSRTPYAQSIRDDVEIHENASRPEQQKMSAPPPEKSNSSTGADNRLGVLGMMKRQVQVV